MKKINILESLKKIDKDTFSEYDLSTLYESHKWSEDQKKQLVRYISSYKDPSLIGQYMAECQDCKNITESDDDDISDLKFIDMSKEAYLHGGDDYGFDEYDIIDHYDDLEDGYDDEELASGFGGDRNTCPKCGGSNYHDGHCYDCEPDYVPSEIDEAFDKEGGPFWYFTRHGVQPGAVPKGIQILDIIDCADGSGSYFKSDKVLTTKELNDFEIVEKKPEGLKEASTEDDIDTVLDRLGGVDKVKARIRDTRRAYPGIEDDELVDMLWNEGDREEWESAVEYLSEDGDSLTTLESIDESKQIGLSLSEKLERIDDLFKQSLKHIGFGYEEVYSLDYATANKLIDQFITYLDDENIDLSYKSEITPLGVKVGGNSKGIAHNYVRNLIKSEWRLMSQAEAQKLLSDMSDTRKLGQYLNENLYHYYEQDQYGFCKRIDRSKFLNLANKQSGSRFIGQGSQMSILDTKVKIYEHEGPGYNFKINVSTLTYDSLQRENKFGIKKNTSDEEVDKFLNESVESKSIKKSSSVSGKYGEVKYEPRRDGMSGESAVYANYHLFSNDGKYTPYWAGERPMGISYNSVEDAVKGIDAFIDRQRKDGKMLYMKPVNEASYGGAFDIEDDQYFTRDDLVEFGEDVVDNLNSLAYSKAELESIFIDNNVIEITITWDGNEITVEQPVDMRRIRTPKDLGKYRVPVISKMKPELEELGFDFGPHLGDYELSESFDTELRDKLVRMWFEENTADWLVKNDPTTAEWLAYGGATTDDFAEVEEEVLAKLNGGDDPKEAKWERLITKSVNDSDGFTTDYSMWYNDGEKRWVFIFGDSDVYDPTNTDPDWETEDPEEARQWFLDYNGFEDTDESLKEDWRTGTFTRDDLTSYRAEMKKRVEGVVFSIKRMKEKHPEYSEIFDNLTDELVDSMSSLKNESLDEDTEEDELETADQKISSAATSINSNKLPAIFRLVKFQPDTMNLDYGGGKFDNAAEELAKINVTNLVYDPYNRSSEHNQDVLKQVRANGGADTVTISNVLNVIAEPEARQTVLRNAKRLVKPGGKVYITVYEGNKSGSGAETKAGYQLNKDTKDYVDEISQVFDNVTRKGKLIIAE